MSSLRNECYTAILVCLGSSEGWTIVGGEDGVSVACGAFHTAVINSAGDLHMCGWGQYGQLVSSVLFLLLLLLTHLTHLTHLTLLCLLVLFWSVRFVLFFFACSLSLSSCPEEDLRS